MLIWEKIVVGHVFNEILFKKYLYLHFFIYFFLYNIFLCNVKKIIVMNKITLLASMIKLFLILWLS